MKYKIKVVVMLDGSSRYYPMAKKHWWSLWKYINGARTTTMLKKKSYPSRHVELAKERIKIYQDYYLSTKIDHTYEIPYKEEEQ